jgi:hypothetical protein
MFHYLTTVAGHSLLLYENYINHNYQNVKAKMICKSSVLLHNNKNDAGGHYNKLLHPASNKIITVGPQTGCLSGLKLTLARTYASKAFDKNNATIIKNKYRIMFILYFILP